MSLLVSEQVDKLISEGNYRLVEDFLNLELKKARVAKDHDKKLCIFNEQLGYYRSISDYQKCLQVCEEILTNLADFPVDENYITTLLNVATVYRTAGQTEKAMYLNALTLRTFHKTLCSNDVLYAALHNNIGLTYLSLDLLQYAKIHLNLSLAVLEKYGMEHQSELATGHTNFGLLMIKMKDYTAAGEHFSCAISLFESLGDEPHYAAALAGMGDLQYISGEYRKALSYYLPALSQIEFFFGRNNDYHIVCRNAIHAATALGENDLIRDLEERGAR